MKSRKKFKRLILVSCIVLLFLLIGILISKKVYDSYIIHKNNELMNNRIRELFVFEDLQLSYELLRKKYGIGTDNRNSNDKIICTTYYTKFGNYNVIKVFYFDDQMNVNKIKIYNSENSKYELLNYLTQFLGKCVYLDNEIEVLSTEYKWNYNDYEISLIDYVDSIEIIIEKING